MEINKLTQHSPNFGAIHISNKKINFNDIETSIDIYKLQPQDYSFISSLKNSTNLKELMPNMKSSYRKTWQYIFDLAVTNIHKKTMTSYIAFNNNKPCGIMNYRNEGNRLFLDTICTFPTEKGQRIPFAGKVLMQTLFDDCIKNELGIIELYAITNSPFNPVSKYLWLGFKFISGGQDLRFMRVRKPNIEESLNKLAKMIKTTEYNEEKNLFEVANTKKS